MISLLTYFAGPGTPLGQACTITGGDILGFPKWYKYLDGTTILAHDPAISTATVCAPDITQLADVWLILAAVIEILLRIAALAAIFWVMAGAIQYITSQAEPAKLEKARGTITNALIGLVIAVTATAIVSYVAGRFN